jgi:hypothetical protein
MLRSPVLTGGSFDQNILGASVRLPQQYLPFCWVGGLPLFSSARRLWQPLWPVEVSSTSPVSLRDS